MNVEQALENISKQMEKAVTVDQLNSITEDLNNFKSEVKTAMLDAEQREQLKGIDEIKAKMAELTIKVKNQHDAGEVTGKNPQEVFRKAIENEEYRKWCEKGKGADSFTISMKAPEDMAVSTNVPDHPASTPIWTPPLYNDPQNIARNMPRMTQIIPSASTSSTIIYEPYEANPEGVPAYVLEASAKPKIDWEWQVKNFLAEEVSTHVIVSEKMRRDVPFMMSKVNELINRRLMLVVDNALMKGTGVSPEIAGLEVLGTAFSGAATGMAGQLGTLTAANKVEILKAAITQMAKANFMASVIVLNPTDYSLMQLKKTTTDDFVRIPGFANASFTNIDGVPVIWHNGVLEGEFYVLDLDVMTNYIREGMRMDIGWINDNFIKNQIAVRAAFDHVLVVNPNNAGGIVYGDFATAATELNTP